MTSASADRSSDILVYGATMPGVAAIRSAVTLLGNSVSICLVNSQPGWGGIGGVGRQNFWDVRRCTPDEDDFVQAGSFERWYNEQGQAYDADRMEQTLRSEVEDLDCVEVLDGWDIEQIETGRDENTVSVRSVTTTAEREGKRTTIIAKVFVDASQSGRLATHYGVPTTTGREDWADNNRQMASTLMFPVHGISWDEVVNSDPNGGFQTRVDPIGARRLFWGGSNTVSNDPAVAAFARAYPRMDIKPMNAAEGHSGTFWLNTLLIYDVDGRTVGHATEQMATDSTNSDESTWTRSQARERAREALADPRFLDALQAFPGFDDLELLLDYNDDPVCADTLYVRETVHSHDGTQDFTLTRDDVERAGKGPDDGADASHYEHRIGVGYYWLDNNGYEKHLDGTSTELGDASNPVYLPFECLTTPAHSDILLPGYATSVSSEAWFEVRVLPNLCVLGDAAGVAAALAVEWDESPGDFDDEQIAAVQHALRTHCDAQLSKPDTSTAQLDD